MVCYNLGKNGYLWLNALLILVKNINMIPLGYEVLSVLRVYSSDIQVPKKLHLNMHQEIEYLFYWVVS